MRAFRDGLIGQLSTSSINHELKILRIAFNSACRAGLMQANPAIQVENLHEKQKHGAEAKKGRRPFTMEEIQKLLSVADQEWCDMILFGLYSGQRLGDLSTLTWGNLHLAEQELRFVSKKTRRNVILPLAQPLLRLIKKWTKGKGASPLFPSAAEAAARSEGRVGTLSNQFHDFMTKAKLVSAAVKEINR